MHKIVLIINSLLLLAACTSNKDLSGLSTASAVLLAVPLAPLAGMHSVVTNESGKLDKQREYWKGQLDPVYLKKDAQIVSRNPQRDAEQVFAQGQVIFIPSRYGVSVYPGLKFALDNEFAEQNQAKINNNPFLVETQNLLAKAPAHQADLSIPYRTNAYWCFQEHANRYKRIFNTRMFELSASSSFNPPGFAIKSFKAKHQCISAHFPPKAKAV
ncbi:hypothetical protein [Oceanisphaera sp. W20_SRM_FM3]|uniref:hypothetical protein n=1 Tax=Oceanisphaera sp. W20_SRM_FM3 TaxID=3240267 RepID=UPI003F9E449D